MNLKVFISLIIILAGCQETPEKNNVKTGISTDSIPYKIQSTDHQSENTELISFLENPIDLMEFKSIKGQSLSSLARVKDYYYKTDQDNYIYYQYSTFPNDSLWKEISPTDMVVLKFGDKKHLWDDDSEVLVELTVTGNDPDLKKADIVGSTIHQLESEFGTSYQVINKNIVYTHANKILVVEFENSKVKWFRYIKLSSDATEQNKIEEIVKTLHNNGEHAGPL